MVPVISVFEIYGSIVSKLCPVNIYLKKKKSHKEKKNPVKNNIFFVRIRVS